VYGCLPFSGTTPRSNLEKALGLSSSTTGYSGCNNLVQNSGNSFSSFANGLGTNDDAVVPISVGSWIGQANGLAVDRISDVLGNSDYGLASINDNGTVLGQPTTGTAPHLASNTTYYQDQDGTSGGGYWGYDLYTVVPTSDVSGRYTNAIIESLFAGTSSVLCSTAAQTEVNDFGFDSLQSDETGSYTCGDTGAGLQGDS